ncbi:MAG TPA: M23 family metallopeptidase [Gemmatimonadaceae bacterium]|nr:M23 family metallopeptidase [Gemmatimonadaceae bacterium]
MFAALAASLVLPFASVSAQSAQSASKNKSAKRETPAAAPVAARLTMNPRQPGTGTLIRLTIDHTGAWQGDSITAITGTIGDEPLHFRSANDGRLLALGAVPSDISDSLVTRVRVERASGALDTFRIFLRYPHQTPPAPTPARPSRPAARTSAARRLRVDTKFTQRLDAETEARIEHENDLARDIGRRAQDTPALWTYPFLRPRDSKVTSRYGTGRVFNGRVSSSHLGIDYRGAVGEPIYAANRGIVALVDSFFLAGNVVYLDHGDGLVTGYFHMSKPEVSVGDTVDRGQEIGLVGATGRVTGPHLHWSARLGASTIDPADLLTLGDPFVLPDTIQKKPPVRRKGP